MDRKLIDNQQSGHTDKYIFLKVIGSALYNEVDAVLLTKEQKKRTLFIEIQLEKHRIQSDIRYSFLLNITSVCLVEP